MPVRRKIYIGFDIYDLLMIMGMIKLIFIISTLAMAPFGDESTSDGA